MGLSYAEKEGCRQILYKLNIDDLSSLYQTVCKTKISVHNKADVIERIIEKSNTASELLNRRKVYKDIILQYLNDKHISMDAKSTKYDAMQKALGHWQPQANIQPCLTRSVDGSTSLGDFGVQTYQVYQNDADFWPPPNTVHQSTLQPRITPQKNRDFSFLGETYLRNTSKLSFTNQAHQKDTDDWSCLNPVVQDTFLPRKTTQKSTDDSFFGENAPFKLTLTNQAHQNDTNAWSYLNPVVQDTFSPSRVTTQKSMGVFAFGEKAPSKLTVTNQLRYGEKDHYIQQKETKAANEAELGSVKQTKVGTKEQYTESDERKAAIKAELGSVKETKSGEKDCRIQCEETKSVNKAAPQPVKETEKSTTATPQIYEDYDTEFKGANFHHYIKEASQKCLSSSHCEILPYMMHLIKLMTDQQKKQDQQYHIVHQLLDMQKENSEQLKDLKETQQTDQHEVLLLQLKENKNHQKVLTDLLQEIKHLIQQQNSSIFLQLQQQQQDFQAKLMKDIAKNTEEQVKVLLQECKPHQTSYNKQSPHEENGINLDADPSAKPKVLNKDKQGRELFDYESVGQAFCNQFYPLWNSQNPSYGQTENITWGPHLFWENATAEIIHYDNEQQVSQYSEGFECVSDSLLNLTKQEKLEFRPSIDNERFKCVNSKHGLVVLAVTGTIFREKRFIGIFEQAVGLIQCPETKSSKIKFTNLKTKYFNHIVDPVTAPILTYTTEQLQHM